MWRQLPFLYPFPSSFAAFTSHSHLLFAPPLCACSLRFPSLSLVILCNHCKTSVQLFEASQPLSLSITG